MDNQIISKTLKLIAKQILGFWNNMLAGANQQPVLEDQTPFQCSAILSPAYYNSPFFPQIFLRLTA